MQNRVILFDGIHNFRDYGGYTARDGARLKSGMLFRSSQHKDATAYDLAQVGVIGLATVIDLRGDSERRRFPCPRPTGFDAAVLCSSGETTGIAPHIEAADRDRSVEETRSAMERSYALMPFRENLVDIFRQYFAALADGSGPSLIHCLAGKDRTGISVALLHKLVGVHADDIMSDYLLTNSAGNVEARIAAGAASVGRKMSEDTMRMLMSVQPEWLDAAFAAMTERHGSASGYARDVLDVTDVQRARIEAALFV
jgi:protein-tyrosine phosphatase